MLDELENAKEKKEDAFVEYAEYDYAVDKLIEKLSEKKGEFSPEQEIRFNKLTEKPAIPDFYNQNE